MKGFRVLILLSAACLLVSAPGGPAWCTPQAQLRIDASPAQATPLAFALGHDLVDVQGTITTDSFGKRIITGAGVWVYTDAVGRALPPNPQVVNTLGANWPFKLRIQ